MVRKGGVDETSRLLTEHLLGKMSMQESIGYIELVNWPGARGSELENGANRARFYNRGEGVGEVHAGALAKATHHPACLIALKRTVRASLVAKDPLASDNIGMRRSRDKLPRAVTLQGVELLSHGGKPVRIPKGCASGGGQGRHGRGGRSTGVLGGSVASVRTKSPGPSPCNHTGERCSHVGRSRRGDRRG